MSQSVSQSSKQESDLILTGSEMPKKYQASKYEPALYALWEKNHAFQPKSDLSREEGKPFTILLPPPNANDPLHLGHAMYVVEDILVRYHRMLGDDTLWLPGTDHAGIETQFVFEKKLKKQGKSRFNFDRETLYQKIWDYVQDNSNTAVDQLKKLGFSLDWSRFRFMLDPDMVEIVKDTFVKMHQDNLVYRDLRLVNYCPKCGTGFSELEVNHEDRLSKLYYMQYGPFVVATTRPETIFGDTAVAVNPNDKRYQKYIGQEIEVDYLIEKRKIKVVADQYVDMEFGTGAVKITPLHDPNDYAIWQKHKDELETPRQVIDYQGRLNQWAGKYQGLKAHIARDQIARDLDKKGLLVKINDKYKNNVGVCYRCKTTIEPLPLPQFYIKVKTLVAPVLQGLKKKDFIVHGAGYDKILKHWLEILQDWNISRQIVWGIRIPVWYSVKKNQDMAITFINQKGERISGKIAELLKNYSISQIQAGLQELKAPVEAEYVVAKENPDSQEYLQETDTFDTWFSSGQWPITTLKAKGGADFKRFYPTQVMETAYDILMFWVMRMLMFGYYLTGETPFKDIYLHGLIRDAKGLKMSKSKGNVTDPLEIVSRYGADALRMALVIRSTAGQDKSVSEGDFKSARNFTNKIWNAARYVIEFAPKLDQSKTKKDNPDFSQHLNKIVTQVTQNLLDLRVGMAADYVYGQFWHWYCDRQLEAYKQGELGYQQLLDGLIIFLKLLHPFLPFVTEAIWQELLKKKLVKEPLLILVSWPNTTGV